MIRDTKGDRVFSIVNGALLTLLTLLIAYPLYFVVIASVSNYIEINSGNVILLPAGLTFDSYRYVLEYKDIWNGYKNTIIITLLGTSINLLFTFTGAYALSKSRLPGMRACMLLITFTMFFGGGLIPTYMLVSDLGMRNTFWAMILPGAVSAYNLVLVRNYYQKNIPEELLQAAMIDGCDDMRVFRSIVLPLSVPMLATMALFYGVGHWNEYFWAMCSLTSRKYYPLQLVLRDILIENQQVERSMENVTADGAAEAVARKAYMAEVMKYALIFISAAPMLAAYPFVQKYFVKGVMIGSVKG